MTTYRRVSSFPDVPFPAARRGEKNFRVNRSRGRGVHAAAKLSHIDSAGRPRDGQAVRGFLIAVPFAGALWGLIAAAVASF